MKIKETLGDLKKYEPYYFYFFLFINLLPVLCFKFFPTADGPAHLYNSRIIVELLENSGSPIDQFIRFNSSLNPNWSGHFILSFCLFFLPSFVAEKIVLLICLTGLPLSVRYLFKTVGIKNNYLVYLVFPFTYSYLFYYGFYNFNIGLVLLFFGLSFWYKYNSNFTFLRILKLMLISVSICLSHLFVFAVFASMIFILNTGSFIKFLRSGKAEKINFLKYYLLQSIFILPGVILAVIFFISNQSLKANATYLSFNDIMISLKYIMPAKGIDYGGYNIPIRILLYVFATLLMYVTSATAYRLLKDKKIFITRKAWLLICIASLVLLFILPDYKGTAIGFISARLMLLFFIFLIIWLASQDVPFGLKACIFLAINVANYLILAHNYRSVAKGCEIAEEINAASAYIDPYSTVLPVNHSNNFLYSHISNYLGTDKPMVILENYEASLDYFPLKWNHAKIPNLLFGNLHAGGACVNWVSTADNPEKQIDYICVISDNDQRANNSCIEQIDHELETNYNLVYSGRSGVKVYKNKTTLTVQ